MIRAYGTIQDAYGDTETNRIYLFLYVRTDDGRIAWQFVPFPSSKQQMFIRINSSPPDSPCVAIGIQVLVAKQHKMQYDNIPSHRLYKRVLACGLYPGIPWPMIVPLSAF